MIITNWKFMKSARQWRLMFAIKDIWIRNDLRMIANELGVELHQTKELERGEVIFFIMDGTRETVVALLERLAKLRKNDVKFSHEKVNGVKVCCLTDLI